MVYVQLVNPSFPENNGNKQLGICNSCDSCVYYGMWEYTYIRLRTNAYRRVYIPLCVTEYYSIFTCVCLPRATSCAAYITESYRSENFPLRVRHESVTCSYNFSISFSKERDDITCTDCTFKWYKLNLSLFLAFDLLPLLHALFHTC